MGQNNANQIEKTVYTLVLGKLKHILVSGFFSMDEVRYEYFWDNALTRDENIKSVMKEDAVVRYFIDMKVIDGLRVSNEFRAQQLRGNEEDKTFGVWNDWKNVDPAYREYEWVVLIHGINTEKLAQELRKFGLVDAGIELAEQQESIKLPQKILDYDNDFAIHQSNIISYRGRRLALEPQVGKIAVFIMGRAHRGIYTSIEDIIDNCLSEDYLSKAEKSKDEQLVYKYVRRCISDARKTLKAYTGETEKDYFPSTTSIGYTFSP